MTTDVTGDGIPDMWVVLKNGELRLYAPKDGRGTAFYIYNKLSTGWGSVINFLPTANPKVIRAVFPDGRS